MRHWSCGADPLLDMEKYQVLQDRDNSLKLRREGYEWYQTHLSDKDYVQVAPSLHPTLVEGCERIWFVPSSKTPSGVSLRRLASKRLAGRFELSCQTFDDHMARRTSCWIVEQRGSNFYCDCPKGSRGLICKHFVGLSYRLGILQVTEDVLSDRLIHTPVETHNRPRRRPQGDAPPSERIPLVRFHRADSTSRWRQYPALSKTDIDRNK